MHVYMINNNINWAENLPEMRVSPKTLLLTHLRFYHIRVVWIIFVVCGGGGLMWQENDKLTVNKTMNHTNPCIVYLQSTLYVLYFFQLAVPVFGDPEDWKRNKYEHPELNHISGE